MAMVTVAMAAGSAPAASQGRICKVHFEHLYITPSLGHRKV